MGGFITWLFRFINTIFFLLGGTLLGIGIWLAVDSDAAGTLSKNGLNDDIYYAAVYTMIGVSAFVFLVGFLGCWGGRNPEKRKCSLRLYCTIIGLTILFEIVIVILAAIFWGSINSGFKDKMKDAVQNQYINETADNDVSQLWNSMQKDSKCCGAEDYLDYRDSDYTRNFNHTVPYTCCVMINSHEYANLLQCRLDAWNSTALGRRSSYLHTKGCYQALKDKIDDNSLVLIIVTSVLAGIEVIGFIIAMSLLCC